MKTILREAIRQLFVPRPGDVPAVNGLRALSLLWVITQHVQQGLRPFGFVPAGATFLGSPLLRLGWAGNLGVDIFFVLSGYLIGGMLMKEREEKGSLSFRRFYLRRAMRILPAYFLAIGFYAYFDPPNRDVAWANVLFVNNFLPFQRMFMAHTWSLAIDEQFYFLFPLYVAIVFRLRPHLRTLVLGATTLMFAIIALEVVLSQDIELSLIRPNLIQFWRYMDIFYTKPYCRFGGIFIGALVVRLERSTGALKALERHPLLATLGAFAALALMAYVALVFPECRAPNGDLLVSGQVLVAFNGYFFSTSIGYLLLLSRSRVLAGRVIERVLGTRVLLPFAHLSYAAFLFHPLVITPLFKWPGFDLDRPVFCYFRLWALGVVLSLLAALAVWVTIEYPVMRRRPPRAA